MFSGLVAGFRHGNKGQRSQKSVLRSGRLPAMVTETAMAEEGVGGMAI